MERADGYLVVRPNGTQRFFSANLYACHTQACIWARGGDERLNKWQKGCFD